MFSWEPSFTSSKRREINLFQVAMIILDSRTIFWGVSLCWLAQNPGLEINNLLLVSFQRGPRGGGASNTKAPALWCSSAFSRRPKRRPGGPAGIQEGGVAANKRQLVRHITQQGIHPLVSEDVAAPGCLCLRNLNFQQAGPRTPVPQQLPDP